MLAPMPAPTNGTSSDEGEVDLTSSAEIEDVRQTLRDTLAQIKAKKQSGRLNEESRLFKLSKKLTTVASEDDTERRRRYLREQGLTTSIDYGDETPES